jgi:hypothetical protein
MKNDVDFLFSIVKAIHKLGVVGEDKAILCLLIKIFLRLVKNGDFVSSNLVLSDLSGSGKDWLVKNLCRFLLPESCFKSYSRVTDKALNYYKIDWNGKVLHLEDVDVDFLNGSVIKTMASGGSSVLATVVGKNDAVEVDIDGKPVMIATSFSAVVDEEGVRRWDYLRLDTTIGQSKAIVLSLIKPIVDRRLQKVLHGLKRFAVVIPFENKIVGVLPSNINMRTEKNKLIDYIRSSTVLFQKYRKIDKSGRLIATMFDYDFACFVFYHFNSSSFSSLSRSQEELFNLVKSSYEDKVSVRYLIANSSLSRKTVYRHIDLLKLFGLVSVSDEYDNSARKEIMFVSVKDAYSLPYLSVLDKSDFDVLLKMIDDFRVKNSLAKIFDDINRL